MSNEKDELLREFDDMQLLCKQEIDPDDFLDRHPEAKKDRRAWRELAVIYNRSGRKKFSWRNARHNYYEESEV
jgi:hypothetical protein